MLIAWGSATVRAQNEGSAPEAPPPPPGGAPPETPPPTSPYDGRSVREVKFEGLKRVTLQFALNQVRTVAGAPYSEAIVGQDVRNLTRLNQFRRIDVKAEPTADGGVIVTFTVDEWARVEDVQVTGNVLVSDQEIAQVVVLRKGDPLDTFQINQARERIQELYKKRGYYLAEVDIDQSVLAEDSILLFRVREGPRVRIKDIEIRGNSSISSKQLSPLLKTKTHILLFRAGQLDSDAVENDIQALRDYYLDRGYLDVRVDRQLDFSNDLREAKLVILVDEGRLYTMRSVKVTGGVRLLRDQLAALMEIKEGDVYSRDKIRNSLTAVRQAYGRLGYVDSTISLDELRDEKEPFIDLLLTINEGEAAYTGEIRTTGNATTKRDVILRGVRVRPDRPLDAVALEESRSNLRQTGLFKNVEVSIQDADEFDKKYRDVLIDVEEGDTGSFSFGAAVSSDLGLFGSIDLVQRNFDVMDFPDSFAEFATGRAFRGAGQTFAMSAQPGSEISNYSISLTEPYLLGSHNSLRTTFAYTTRELESWDEDRLGGRFQLGRRLGDVWSISGSVRVQQINLSNIDVDAPVDAFAVEDENLITALGVTVARSTVDDRFRATRGSRLELAVEQIGLVGGDFDFTRVEGEYAVILPVDEDFLGRRSVLSLRTRAGYLFGGETPIYERYYLGGRGLRGFDFRTVSPKGIRNDTGGPGFDPVGGDFLLFLGAEYEFPVFDRFIGAVVFVDSGTVLEDPGLDDYRASIGAGMRLYIPQLGQAPLAFDFAIPLASEDRDATQVFSFSIDLPFR